MIRDIHDIDKLFKDGIEGHKEDVPDAVWENISNKLDEKQAVSFEKKYYRLRRLAIAVVLLGFLSGVYALYSKFVAPHEDVVVKTVPKTKSFEKANDNALKENSTTVEQKKSVVSDENIVDSKNNLKESSDETNKVKEQSSSSTINNNNSDVKKEHSTTEVNAPTKTVVKKIKSNNLPERSEANNSTQPKTKIVVEKKISLPDEKPVEEQSITSLLSERTTSNIALMMNAEVFIANQLNTIAHPLFASDATSVNLSSIAKQKIKTPASFSLTAFAGPDFSFENFKDNDHFAGPPGGNRQEAKRDEQQSTSFTTGLLLDYNLNSKWSIQSGIMLTTSITNIAPSTVYARPDNNGRIHFEFHCSSGYSYIEPGNIAPQAGDSAKAMGSKTKLQYTSVPLAVRYHLNAGRFSFLPAAGFTLNFLAQGKVETTIQHGTDTESSEDNITGLRSSYLNGLVSVGAEYKLTRNVSLTLIPSGRFAVTAINKNTPVSSYPNYFSLAGGVRVSF